MWDREFGFLREMLAAPVSRSAIVIGKCLGATVSTLQGIVILRLAGLAGVPRNPILILTVIGELLLLTYAGYPMRQAVFSHLTVSPAASAVLSPSVTRGRGPV